MRLTVFQHKCFYVNVKLEQKANLTFVKSLSAADRFVST